MKNETTSFLLILLVVGTLTSPQSSWADQVCETNQSKGFFSWVYGLFAGPEKDCPTTQNPQSLPPRPYQFPEIKSATATEIFLKSLSEDKKLDSSLKENHVWTNLLEQDPYLRVYFQKAESQTYRRKVEVNLTMKFLFQESSGVSEGYSIGEHSVRVLDVYESQKIAHGLKTLPGASGIKDFERLMKYTLAFHDIGKSIAHRSGDKGREVVFSNPLASVLLKATDFTVEERRLGVSLINDHQIIGTYLQKKWDLETAVQKIREGAEYAQLDPRTYMALMEFVFVCDAGSYNALRYSIFSMNSAGKLSPSGPSYENLLQAYNDSLGLNVDELRMRNEELRRLRIETQKKTQQELEEEDFLPEQGVSPI